MQIPAGVYYIGKNAFQLTSSMTSISYGGSQERWERVNGKNSGLGNNVTVTCGRQESSDIAEYTDGKIYYDPSNGIVFDCDETAIAIKIPSNIEGMKLYIGNGAFAGRDKITSVTIDKGITSIGGDAFCGCTGLTSITLPEGLMVIGEDAFSYCSNLTSIAIPRSVTSIGDFAFLNCSALKDVYFGGSKEEWEALNWLNAGVSESVTIHYVPVIVRGVTATLREGGFDAMLSKRVTGVQYAYAATYENDRMVGIVRGRLLANGTDVHFDDEVPKGSVLFLLNAEFFPLCEKITLTSA